MTLSSLSVDPSTLRPLTQGDFKGDSQEKAPLVSVVIPTYNYGQYISAAINSVLDQTFTDYEIIVVDDGSTDDTTEQLAPYRSRIRYCHQPNQGLCAARNQGIRLAKGQLIAFLDADDYFLPEFLSAQVAIFQQQPDLALAISGWRMVDEAGQPLSDVALWHHLPHLTLSDWINWRPLLPSATVFSKRWLAEVNGFDAGSFPAEDIDCVFNLILQGAKTCWVKRIGVCYRQHSKAITHDTPRQVRAFEQLYDRLFARPDLSDECRQLENTARYNCLLWGAWRLFHTGYPAVMVDTLHKALSFAVSRPTATIQQWLSFFENNCQTHGYVLDAEQLTQAPGWQTLLQRVLHQPPPRVSVIMPAYNAAPFISAAVNSVLAQTYTDYELIVIDDGSTDDTLTVLSEKFDLLTGRIRCQSQPNQGVAVARNRGLALARGELIALLDADDFFLPDKLTQQVAICDRHPQAGIVNSGFRVVDAAGVTITDVTWWTAMPKLDYFTWTLYKPVLPSAMMFRRRWIDRVGGFDSRFPPAEDLDLTMRLVAAGCPAVWLKQITAGYRLHDNSASIGGTLKLARSAEAVLDHLFSQDALPTPMRHLAAPARYQTLVWVAWRLYSTGLFEDGVVYLNKSLDDAPYITWVETVNHWMGLFSECDRTFGYASQIQQFQNCKAWQNLIGEMQQSALSVSQSASVAGDVDSL